jgi:hypothetical protein
MPEQDSTTTNTRFLYRGPTSGATLRLPEGKSLEVMLFDGEVVELPASNAHVGKLIAQGFLTETTDDKDDKTAPANRRSTRSPSTENKS